jgi:hypothetical protein
MEQGFEYLLPSSYAFELVNHGLAEFVSLPAVEEGTIPASPPLPAVEEELIPASPPPVNVVHKPPKIKVMDTALREMRAKNQEFIDPIKTVKGKKS